MAGTNEGEYLTDRAGQDEEVIVGQGSVVVGVEKGIDMETISGRILLQDLQGLGVVQDFDHYLCGEIRLERNSMKFLRGNSSQRNSEGQGGCLLYTSPSPRD